MIQLFDRNGHQIEIERTSFIRFIDEGLVCIYSNYFISKWYMVYRYDVETISRLNFCLGYNLNLNR